MRSLLIALVTMSALGALRAATADRGIRSPRSRLFVLSIGVSNYANEGLFKAAYTAGDARAIARILADRCGTVYSEVSTRVLTNEKATRSGILEGLDWIQRETTAADVTIIYLAVREGVARNGVNYIAAYDFEKMHPTSTSVSLDEFARSASQAAGRKILFIDPHPQDLGGGGFTELPRPYDLTEGGRFSEFLADKVGPMDIYSSRWSDHIFAMLLIRGLKGEAADANGQITLFGLAKYVARNVTAEFSEKVPLEIKAPDMPDIMLALAPRGSR